MEEREVPPVVHREEAVVAQASGLPRIQAMPSPLPALHLHHVRHGMLRPAVARLELDGAAADASARP